MRVTSAATTLLERMCAQYNSCGPSDAFCRFGEDMRFRASKATDKFVMRITVREASRGIGRGGREVGHALVDTSIVTRQLDKLRRQLGESGARCATVLATPSAA